MPLMRVEVRNEYGLGMPELYTETDREDPKAVLDGVAAAGLIGILRQLGDLAEFAVEIFHGLQEQVLITSSRSHKLAEQVHHIESALPPLEKAILGQRSHLHFAYTAGSKWHTHLGTEQNHFIYSDLPCCIMDSYEDCYDPPRLHNLDKFDIGGPGSCFRRYSDLTFFKRSSTGHYEVHLQNIPREKKARRNKMCITSEDFSTIRGPQKIEIAPEVDHLTSFDSRNGSAFKECIFHPSQLTQSGYNNVQEPSSVSHVNQDSYLDSPSLSDNFNNSCLAEDSRSKSNFITWDEKLEILDSIRRPHEPTVTLGTPEKMDTEVMEDLDSGVVDHVDFDLHDAQPRKTTVIIRHQHDEIESETDNYMDAINKVESESPEPSWSTTGGQTTVSNPVMFWTNGGLLGLVPSKPPNFGLPAVAEHPGQQKDIKSEASSKMIPKLDSVNSSRMFKLRNRLFVNGFRKQVSLVGNERLAGSVISNVPRNTKIQYGYQTVTEIPFREQTTFISPSSPPLEHMRLSFQPIDGFETSKMKLAFPDGNNNGSNGLMLSSFQLVPEPEILLHEFASDTDDDDDDDDDDDTFCRSSPYASDGCHSNCYESNSEQWDSSDSPRIKNHISSAESVSSSLVNGIEFQQGVPDHKSYGYQSSFDNPNFDYMKASQSQVTNDLNGPKQPLPPMPPIEWRSIKPEPTLPQPFKPAPAKQDNVVVTDSLTLKHKQPDWENLHVQNGSIHALNEKGEEKDDFLQQIRKTLRNLRPISAAQSPMSAGPASIKVTSILEKASTIGQSVGGDDGEGNWSDT